RIVHLLPVGTICDDPFHLGGQIRRGATAIEHGHIVSIAGQCVDEMTPDEHGTTEHQRLHLAPRNASFKRTTVPSRSWKLRVHSINEPCRSSARITRISIERRGAENMYAGDRWMGGSSCRGSASNHSRRRRA